MPLQKNTAAIFTLGSVFAFFSPTAHAATACYKLLAPIGTFTSGVCYTLKDYLEGIFTTAIGIAGLLAVIMIVVCGVKLVAGASPSAKSEAKECIYNAIFGVLIAIGSWLLLNTINPQLLKNDAELTVMASSTAAAQNIAVDDPMPILPSFRPGFYYRYKGSDGKNKNSPVYTNNDACTAAMKGDRDSGTTMSPGPDGSTLGCFNLPQSTTPVGAGEEATRSSICGNSNTSCILNAKPPTSSASNVYVNAPPCVPYNTDFHASSVKPCTNVGGLDGGTVQFIKDLASQCGCQVVITGGTEEGHKSHGANIPVFDLSRTEKLFGYIKSKATVSNNPSFCNYKDGKVGPCFNKWLFEISGNKYWFTDETGGSNTPHWHVCKDGTVAPPDKPVGLYIKACTKI